MLPWAIFGAVFASACASAYYFLATAIGMFPRIRRKNGECNFTIAVLIPAHDEATRIARAIQSLPFGTEILVVADNCTDATADIAHSLMAKVLERRDDTKIGKGYALAFGLPTLIAAKPDAILLLDADGEIKPGTWIAFQRAIAEGFDVVQAPVEYRDPHTSASIYVAAVGGAVDNAVDRGLDTLGFSPLLRGSGMLFRRDVLERHPWSMHGLAEDAEFSAVLRKAGVRIRWLRDGGVLSEAPAELGNLLRQRRRWRAALGVPGIGIVRRATASKPMLLAAMIVTGFALLFVDVPTWIFSTHLVSLSLIVSVYLMAMAKVGFRIPGPGIAAVIGRLAWLTLAGLWRKRESTWLRTHRD